MWCNLTQLLTNKLNSIYFKFIIILIWLNLNVEKAAAQKYETNPHFLRTTNWYFGDSVAIRFFNEDSIIHLPSFKGWTYEGTAILNDKNGNLRFYSEGKYLYNKNHNKVNETHVFISDNSSSQRVIISENPIDSQYINIFTTSPTYSENQRGWRYSLFDSHNDTFIFLNKILVSNIGEKQASINHQNNTSIWHISHKETSDTFFLFLLTPSNSLLCCPKMQSAGSYYYDYFPSQGRLKFSENGKYATSCNWNLFNFDIFHFNSEIGLFIGSKTISASWPLGCELITTKDSIRILVITDKGNKILAYSFHADTNFEFIQSSLNEIYKNGIADNLDDIQRSIFGKVYCSKYNQNEILELQLLADTFSINQILIENKSRGGLPNFNASYFYTPSIDFAYTEDCWEHKYSFEGRDTFDADGYKWIFEKSGFRDSILTKHCNYQFSDTGSWQVSHIAWNANRADTVTKTLTIRPKWQKDVLGRDTFYCAGSKANLVLQAPTDMHCVHWNGEEPNLDETLGPIVDYDHFHVDTFRVDTAGTYIVKLTNKTFCQMYDTIEVAEKPRPTKSVVSRSGNMIMSNVVASQYRWYYNGALQQTTDSNFLDPNQNGNWQVQLVSEFGCESELSDSILVDFASIDPRLQDAGQLTFKIYPNPSSGKFTIELAQKKSDIKIEVLDLNGKVVHRQYSKNSELVVLNLDLAAGSYTLQVTDEEGNTGVKKVVVE
jgi:hypothetical protein